MVRVNEVICSWINVAMNKKNFRTSFFFYNSCAILLHTNYVMNHENLTL